MKRFASLLFGIVALGGLAYLMAPAAAKADGPPKPIFLTKIPPGYRNWRLISVSHE
jgi:hypothetical protein